MLWAKVCSQYVNWTELTCNKTTNLLDAFIGHARQRHDLIGCSETRTVGAQSVRALWTLPLEYTSSELEFSSVQILCCEQTFSQQTVKIIRVWSDLNRLTWWLRRGRSCSWLTWVKRHIHNTTVFICLVSLANWRNSSTGQIKSLCISLHTTWWLGSRVVSVLDSGAEGPGFKSQSRRCRVTV